MSKKAKKKKLLKALYSSVYQGPGVIRLVKAKNNS